jgi:small-conductance mechanosensitive channel
MAKTQSTYSPRRLGLLLPLLALALATATIAAMAQPAWQASVQTTQPAAAPQTAQTATPGQAPRPGQTAPAPALSEPQPQPRPAQAAQPAPAAPPPAPPAYAAAGRETGMDINGKFAEWDRELERIEKELEGNRLRYRDLDRQRERLGAIRGDVEGFMQVLQPRFDAFKAQVESLGPAPAKDAPPEPDALAQQRADWNATLGSLTTARNAAEATRLRTSQLSAKVQEIRRQRFTSRLLERVPEAHSLATWRDAPGQIVYAAQQASQAVANWWMLQESPEDVNLILFTALLMALAMGFLSSRWVGRMRVLATGSEQPPFWRRGAAAAWLILLRALPVAVPVTFTYWALHSQELMPTDVDRLAYSAMRSILIVTAVTALVTTALAPRHLQWRLIPADDAAATRIRWLVVGLAATYSLNLFLGTVRSVAFAPFGVTLVQSLVASVIIALMVMAILRTRLQAASIEGAPEVAWMRVLRIPLWTVAILILAAAAAGYIPLARFVSAQLIVTGTILAVVYLMLIWADAFGQSMSDPNAATGRWLMATLRCEQRRCEQFALPVTLVLKLAVLLFSVPLILLQWGFDWKDITEWSRELFFGFRVGNTQISIAAILASLMVFALGYFAARLFQGWLDRQVLEPAGISGSVRNSIRTGVGYLGVIVAALFAISYAGLDLSNVAIVAGALSVGVGFGLQSIVNNFVSGLILLVERPIKVGDWVVVGGEEGLVRRISVRSTEIETFDRANVLVPNSYFITESVKNWTLHNYSGRVIIPVGVHYDSDPRLVKELLLKVARENPQVMNNPEPFVLFEDFGSDALAFKLFAYVFDITKGIGVRTDLRIAILETFKQHGIEVPYRQTDVHLRNMDWLKRAMLPPAATPPRQRRRQRMLSRGGNGHGAGSNGNGHGREA